MIILSCSLGCLLLSCYFCCFFLGSNFLSGLFLSSFSSFSSLCSLLKLLLTVFVSVTRHFALVYCKWSAAVAVIIFHVRINSELSTSLLVVIILNPNHSRCWDVLIVVNDEVVRLWCVVRHVVSPRLVTELEDTHARRVLHKLVDVVAADCVPHPRCADSRTC